MFYVTFTLHLFIWQMLSPKATYKLDTIPATADPGEVLKNKCFNTQHIIHFWYQTFVLGWYRNREPWITLSSNHCTRLQRGQNILTTSTQNRLVWTLNIKLEILLNREMADTQLKACRLYIVLQPIWITALPEVHEPVCHEYATDDPWDQSIERASLPKM